MKEQKNSVKNTNYKKRVLENGSMNSIEVYRTYWRLMKRKVYPSLPCTVSGFLAGFPSHQNIRFDTLCYTSNITKIKYCTESIRPIPSTKILKIRALSIEL